MNNELLRALISRLLDEADNRELNLIFHFVQRLVRGV